MSKTGAGAGDFAMELTEKSLGEMGGWQAMKAARGLVDAGLVKVTTAEPGLIRGTAGGGRTPFAAGLRIRSRTDADNLCTCPMARRGLICDHSLAVALAHLRASQPGGGSGSRPGTSFTSSSGAGRSLPPSASAGRPGGGFNVARPAPVPVEPPKLLPRKVAGRYSVYLPESFLLPTLATRPGGAAVLVQFTAGGEGEESLLAEWLHREGVGQRTSPLSLTGSMLNEFLGLLAGHPRVLAGKPSGGARAVAIADHPVRPAVLATSGSEEDSVRLALGVAHVLPVPGTSWWVAQDTATLFQVPTESSLTEVAAALTAGPVQRPLRWLVEHREALSRAFEVEFAGPVLSHFHVMPVPATYVVELDGSLQAAEVRLRARYEKQEWKVLPGGVLDLNQESIFPIHDQSNKAVFYVRDTYGESRFLARIERLGFVEQGGFWRLSGAERVVAFFATELPRLEADYKVVLGDKWRAATRGIARIAPRLETSMQGDGDSRSGGDGGWLTMEFSYQAPDGFRIGRSEILRMVRSGQRTFQAKNGKRYLLDAGAVEEMEETLRDVPIQLGADSARISALHAPYLLGGEALDQKDLLSEEEMAPRLAGLKAQLRPYQLLGVRWMEALIRKKRGGVLGDEMGLGKTVQSIATILTQRSAAKDGGAPTLVVCPKSLVGNWKAEVERFAPGLKVVAAVGAGREKVLARLVDFDVIITTYQLIVNDLEIYGKVHCGLVLLDEASFIRNPDTEAAKALRSLKAGARLALTGTPVENTTRDLWSIYQFALPGYLGSRDDFKERFETPIQNNLNTPAGQAASERLKKLIRPYFLRRTKREVLKDLPEKIEQVLWCDPTPPQAELYRRLLEEGREEIKAARKRSGQGGAKMTMFTVLLRLRQACCDLRLTGVDASALKGVEAEELSGKWAVWEERLDQILDSGGKVLIFSQFVQFLHLMRQKVEARKRAFCYLDGSSQDREAQVKRFQTDPEVGIFLISLKAGGYGLNLTAADHVILTDPWWNPAVEAQAIDRAHRIGQERVVTAYRLAIRGTVEERILALQAKKRGLVEAALDEKSPLMAGLTDGDLEGLLED